MVSLVFVDAFSYTRLRYVKSHHAAAILLSNVLIFIDA